MIRMIWPCLHRLQALSQQFFPIPRPVQPPKIYQVLLNRLSKELDSRSKESGQEGLIVGQWIYRWRGNRFRNMPQVDKEISAMIFTKEIQRLLELTGPCKDRNNRSILRSKNYGKSILIEIEWFIWIHTLQEIGLAREREPQWHWDWDYWIRLDAFRVREEGILVYPFIGVDATNLAAWDHQQRIRLILHCIKPRS